MPLRITLEPPAATTEDLEMDRLLFDLEAVDGAIRKAATDRLVGMKPNQHRAVVAKKLAEQLSVVEPYAREPLIRELSVWATAAEVPSLIQLLDSPEIHIRNVTLDALGKPRHQRPSGRSCGASRNSKLAGIPSRRSRH